MFYKHPRLSVFDCVKEASSTQHDNWYAICVCFNWRQTEIFIRDSDQGTTILVEPAEFRIGHAVEEVDISVRSEARKPTLLWPVTDNDKSAPVEHRCRNDGIDILIWKQSRYHQHEVAADIDRTRFTCLERHWRWNDASCDAIAPLDAILHCSRRRQVERRCSRGLAISRCNSRESRLADARNDPTGCSEVVGPVKPAGRGVAVNDLPSVGLHSVCPAARAADYALALDS